jgi:AcrR family transcriptional regulator
MARFKDSKKVAILEETRDKLLQSAAAEFAREGYQGGNVNRISTAAGFAKGTIYNYFSSKEDLMKALITDIAHRQTAAIRVAVLAESDPAERLEAFFIAGFQFARDEPDRARVAVTTAFGPDTTLKAYEYRAYEPLFALFSREVLAYGVEAGAFREMDLEKMTLLLMTLYLAGNAPQTPDGEAWMGAGDLSRLALHGIMNQEA